MTIFLVLGLFAGLYLLWLMFSLAAYALPLYAGLGFGLWLHSHGYGYPASIIAGLTAGAATLAIGRLAFDLSPSPATRLVIALMFVLPAGFAGYSATHGILGLALGGGAALTILSLAGACLIAGRAWSQLGSLDHSPSAEMTSVQSGSAG